MIMYLHLPNIHNIILYSKKNNYSAINYIVVIILSNDYQHNN